MLSSSVVDRVFIGVVIVSMLSSSVVDRVFIGVVIVSMLSSSVVDRVFETWSGQSKDYEIRNCSFSATQAALKRKKVS